MSMLEEFEDNYSDITVKYILVTDIYYHKKSLITEQIYFMLSEQYKTH